MADEITPPALPATTPSAPRVSASAIVSLVLAILSFACLPIVAVIPAIVCGHVAWSRITRSGGAVIGKGIAIAGLIIGYLAIPWAVLQVWFLAGMIQGERERLHDLKVKREEIRSDDGKLSISASGFWLKMSDLNKKAPLQAGYKSNDMYVMVITDPKDTVPDMTLEQHHQITREHMLQKMENSSATQAASVTIDGHPAFQDELSGKQEGANLVFLHTTVDEGDAYQQILAWTTESHWPKQNQELREVTNTFHSEK
jgi:uncharacterized protein DUF4190